jgi:hypothetical protein
MSSTIIKFHFAIQKILSKQRGAAIILRIIRIDYTTILEPLRSVFAQDYSLGNVFFIKVMSRVTEREIMYLTVIRGDNKFICSNGGTG